MLYSLLEYNEYNKLFSVHVDKMRSCDMNQYETINLFFFSYVRVGNMAALLLFPHPVVC